MTRDHFNAFTLIETLAVIALLGIVGAVFAAALARPAESARFDTVASALLDLDGRARRAALSEGPIVLRVDRDDQAIVVVRASDAPDDTPLMAVTYPSGIEIALSPHNGIEDEGTPIHINAAGRSVDYRIVIRTDRTTIVWDIAGLTGWVSEHEDDR